MNNMAPPAGSVTYQGLSSNGKRVGGHGNYRNYVAPTAMGQSFTVVEPNGAIYVANSYEKTVAGHKKFYWRAAINGKVRARRGASTYIQAVHAVKGMLADHQFTISTSGSVNLNAFTSVLGDYFTSDKQVRDGVDPWERLIAAIDGGQDVWDLAFLPGSSGKISPAQYYALGVRNGAIKATKTGGGHLASRQRRQKANVSPARALLGRGVGALPARQPAALPSRRGKNSNLAVADAEIEDAADRIAASTSTRSATGRPRATASQ